MRGAGVGNAVGWDVDEELGDTAQAVRDCHPPDGDVRDKLITIGVDTVERSGMVVAGRGLVSLPSDKGVSGA